MKHFLLMTYSIYFACLMVVPCNHTLLYTKAMENMMGINMHKNCSHNTNLSDQNHHHHDKHSDHHHSCTPFCSCGITHFVLHVPQFQNIPSLNIAAKNETALPPTTMWAISADNYKKLVSTDIWHPPQVV